MDLWRCQREERESEKESKKQFQIPRSFIVSLSSFCILYTLPLHVG
jgi:hypothetical protein